MFTVCSLYAHCMFTVCSLDSHCMFTTGSLHAHFIFSIYPILQSLSTDETSSTLHLPIVNAAKTDLPLRTEVTALFSKLKISTDYLICIDEVDLEEICRDFVVKITLVDHNVLANSQRKLQENVVEIIGMFYFYNFQLKIWLPGDSGQVFASVFYCFKDQKCVLSCQKMFIRAIYILFRSLLLKHCPIVYYETIKLVCVHYVVTTCSLSDCTKKNAQRLIWWKLKTSVHTRSAFIFSESSYFNLKFDIKQSKIG